MLEKRKDLEKVGFGIAIMFGIYWVYSIFIQNSLPIAQELKTMIGLITLYGIGLTFFIMIIRKIPNTKIEKKNVKFSTIVQCFLLQFTAIMIMSVISNVIAKITSSEINSNLDTLTPYMLVMLLIFNPVVEEFVFRKLFADKLLKYGELFYILVSSFCFAIVHGVSLGIPQIVYTFILGMIWSYLVVKTGGIILSIILHSLSNLFGSIIIQLLQGISVEFLGIYSMFITLLAIIGLISFIRNRKKIKIDNNNKIIDKNILKDMITNKGTIFYMVLTAIMIIVKNILIK